MHTLFTHDLYIHMCHLCTMIAGAPAVTVAAAVAIAVEVAVAMAVAVAVSNNSSSSSSSGQLLLYMYMYMHTFLHAYSFVETVARKLAHCHAAATAMILCQTVVQTLSKQRILILRVRH